MKSIVRRSFLKKTSKAGIVALSGASTFPQLLSWEIGNDSILLRKKQKPICKVKKEVYVAYPKLGMAPITSMSYVGRGMNREEIRSFMQSSNWSESTQRRTFENNGRSWSDWMPVPKQAQTLGQFTQSGGESQNGSGPLDPVSGRLVKPVFQRIFEGVPQVALKEIWKGNRLFWDHGFYQLSTDNGKTWGKAFQLKYEEGADFNPADWGNREGCVAGAMCFVGRWNKTKMNYDWEKSNSVFLPRQVSSRGLVELDLSELNNGNLMLIMRGANIWTANSYKYTLLPTSTF